MERLLCPEQEKSHDHLKSDLPCPICAGTMPSDKMKTGVCPFTIHEENDNYCQLRDDINPNNITATERYFLIQQQQKVDKLKE